MLKFSILHAREGSVLLEKNKPTLAPRLPHCFARQPNVHLRSIPLPGAPADGQDVSMSGKNGALEST